MKSFLIIGMGEFGKQLALELSKMHNEVCIVDTDSVKIEELSTKVTRAYAGDCTRESTIKELGVNNYDVCVVAIGESFQSSLEITALLKENGAKYIISKAISPVQMKFLMMAGANETVYPEKEIAEKTAVRCSVNNLLDFITVSDKHSIVEIKVPEDWIGESIMELNIRRKYDVNVVAISNNNEVTLPSAEYVFKDGDHMFVIGVKEMVDKLIRKEV